MRYERQPPRILRPPVGTTHIAATLMVEGVVRRLAEPVERLTHRCGVCGARSGFVPINVKSASSARVARCSVFGTQGAQLPGLCCGGATGSASSRHWLGSRQSSSRAKLRCRSQANDLSSQRPAYRGPPGVNDPRSKQRSFLGCPQPCTSGQCVPTSNWQPRHDVVTCVAKSARDDHEEVGATGRDRTCNAAFGGLHDIHFTTVAAPVSLAF